MSPFRRRGPIPINLDARMDSIVGSDIITPFTFETLAVPCKLRFLGWSALTCAP